MIRLLEKCSASKRFGRNLSKLLVERSMSYYDLEKFTGVNYRSIARYAHGEVTAPLDAVEKIARYFGKTVDEMVKEEL